MVRAKSRIILLLISFITCNSNLIDDCNDQCLLTKLGFYSDQQQTSSIILNGYDLYNGKFIDNALIWIEPTSYFSDSFIKQITSSQTIPSDDNFREFLYQKYIASKDLSFILSINTKLNDEHMINVVKSLMHKYHFDGYNEINRRGLQGNYGQGDDEVLEFDVLNQRTYDEYDWFLWGFTIFTFGCLCMCCGWCSHKRYVKDKIIQDDDVQSLATPISPSGDAKDLKYSFAGFNIFGENMGRDASKTTSNEQNHIYDIDPTMQYQEILSKTGGTKGGTPTFGSIPHSMMQSSIQSNESQISDIELAENTHRNGLGTISHTLSPEFKPRDTLSHTIHTMHTPQHNIHSRNITPLVTTGYSGNHLTADPRLITTAKQFGLYDNSSTEANDNIDETPTFGHDTSHRSTASHASHQSHHAKFGHNTSNTMTVLGTPITHYGAQVTLGHTPIPPSRDSHVAGRQSFPQDLIVYEDPDGNIVGVAQIDANGEIISTQPLPGNDQQLPQLLTNHSPNNLHPQSSAQSLPGMSPQNSSSPRNKYKPPPISVSVNGVDDNNNNNTKKDNIENDTAPPSNGPTLITLMSNPDQKQKKAVPHIIMPTRESAIIPKYKAEMIVSPGTVDVIASPDSDDPSQTHLSLDICIGNSNSVDGKSGAYGRVILPLKDNDSLQTPVIDEDAELEDRILDAAFKPAPPPGTPPNKSSSNSSNKPRPPPGPPPQRSNNNIPQDVGLEVIVEGPEDEEVMSPESVHSLRKTYEAAIASDIIPIDNNQNDNDQDDK